MFLLPSIAVDLDGVVADFYKLLIQVYNSRHSPSLRLEQITDYDFSVIFSEDVVDKIVPIFNEPKFFERLNPMPRAIEVLSDLRSAGYKIIICTAPARGRTGLINGLSAFEKLEWVAKHLPSHANDVIITMLKQFVQTDMLVDDYPFNIVEWCKMNPKGVGYLVDQVWNRSTTTSLPKNAVRGSLLNLHNFVDSFWCPERGVFGYTTAQLKKWEKEKLDCD